MHTKRPPLAVILIVILLVLSTIGYFIWKDVVRNPASKLSASGTIEATTSAIAPEISGKIAEVKVSEGDQVKKGDILFILESALIKAQRNQAAAALESVRAGLDTALKAKESALTQYQIVLEASQAEDQKTRKTDWFADQPYEFDEPTWYFTRSEKALYANDLVNGALTGLQDKQKNLDYVESKTSSQTFIHDEQQLLLAQQAFLMAKDVLDSAKDAGGYDELRDAAQDKYDDLEDALDDAQKAYDDDLTSDAADEIIKARAEVRVAQELYDTAVDYARGFQTGISSLKVTAAQNSVDYADAALKQAQSAVNQAQANLEVLDTQIGLLTITSPQDGVVLTRLIEPGEVINAGFGALTIADLSNLHLTVYVPEDRIGEISLGKPAKVTVDSFPGQTFSAKVDYISDQAEFTPRNVQTAEGRRNTVFAVRLQLEDASGRLKPGMPADVSFE